jgi:tRNA uridine 5-carboxymethylaminomethyl modification enzyme
LKRPSFSYEELCQLDPSCLDVPAAVREQVEIQVKYAGYIDRQIEQIGKMAKMEETLIPADLDYGEIKGITAEVREKLERFRPDTLGQASRIQGVTPAALAVLSIVLKARGMK